MPSTPFDADGSEFRSSLAMTAGDGPNLDPRTTPLITPAEAFSLLGPAWDDQLFLHQQIFADPAGARLSDCKPAVYFQSCSMSTYMPSQLVSIISNLITCLPHLYLPLLRWVSSPPRAWILSWRTSWLAYSCC